MHYTERHKVSRQTCSPDENYPRQTPWLQVLGHAGWILRHDFQKTICPWRVRGSRGQCQSVARLQIGLRCQLPIRSSSPPQECEAATVKARASPRAEAKRRPRPRRIGTKASEKKIPAAPRILSWRTLNGKPAMKDLSVPLSHRHLFTGKWRAYLSCLKPDKMEE